VISGNLDFLKALKRQEKWLSGIVLCGVIFLIWSWVHSRTSMVAWQTPLRYEGGKDVAFVLAYAKAFMDGDIFPVLSKWVSHLNAPFSANWNDYPVTDEFIYAAMGWIGKGIGLFPAANLMVLLAHLLTGLSFYYVGRKLKYRLAFVFAGAVLFTFFPYSFPHNLVNIMYSYYGHIPLMLLVSWWAFSSTTPQIKSRKWSIAVVIAAISGTFNVYYTGMFLQFLGFTVLLHLARKEYRLITFPLLLIGVTVASFLIMNADTLSYTWFHGQNPQAIVRNLTSLDKFALRIPSLVFPQDHHRWHAWAEYGQSHYFIPTMIEGEKKGGYLGLVGLAGLMWLTGTSLFRLLQGKLNLIPIHAWQILWVLLFSLAGGINLLLGTFGFVLFRCTFRYGLFIFALVLLFLVRQLSRKCSPKWTIPLACGIIVIGLWDQLPPKDSPAEIQRIANFMKSERNFSKELEAQLPQDSMVFQLPVVAFPETRPIYQMTDYEHFRPYLFTRHLHYSYGTNKGRRDADWQVVVNKLTPADMIAKLESYGFGAIIINRKGYEDKAVQLLEGIVATGRSIIADNGELVAIKLKPMAKPILPEIPPFYSTGWSLDEGTHRWAISRHAEINIFNNDKKPKQVTIKFALITLKPRNVRIGINGTTLQTASLDNTNAKPYFELVSVTLNPGGNSLFIDTDVPPQYPGNNDSRKISFGISGFMIKEYQT